MKKFYQRHRKVINIIAIVLATALVMGIIATSTSLIAKVSNSNIGGFRERNDDNLIDVASYEKYDGEQYSGVKFDVDEHGVITLDGEADARISKKIASVSYSGSGDMLEDYLYVSGCLDGSINTYYFTDGENDWYQTDDSSNVVQYCSLDGSTALIDIYLVIEQGAELDNVKIYPAVFTDPDARYFG